MKLGKLPVARRPGGSQLSMARALCYLALGLAIGGTLGFLMMGTAHAVLETKGKSHFGNNENINNEVPSVLTPFENGGETEKQQIGASIHTLATSNGSPYQNYQMRIAYATYNLMKEMPGGGRHVAFTRILHRTKDDELMDEIPTFRADPLQPECDNWCEYPVSDRANAVKQFFQAAKEKPDLIKANWLYMIESDYVFMKPLQSPPLKADDTLGWGFPFDYIRPQQRASEMQKLFPKEMGPISKIPGTGPAPFVMTRSAWEAVTLDWERLTAEVESDASLKHSLGWVREMYAFSVALAVHNITVDLVSGQKNRFIAQLPIDSSLGEAHAYHYTQCTIYKSKDGDKDVWKYDKRFYTTPEDALNVRLIDEPPPFEEGKWKFIEGPPVTREKHESITEMIKQMNRGIATLKPITIA